MAGETIHRPTAAFIDDVLQRLTRVVVGPGGQAVSTVGHLPTLIRRRLPGSLLQRRRPGFPNLVKRLLIKVGRQIDLIDEEVVTAADRIIVGWCFGSSGTTPQAQRRDKSTTGSAQESYCNLQESARCWRIGCETPSLDNRHPIPVFTAAQGTISRLVRPRSLKVNDPPSPPARLCSHATISVPGTLGVILEARSHLEPGRLRRIRELPMPPRSPQVRGMGGTSWFGRDIFENFVSEQSVPGSADPCHNGKLVP